MDAFLAIASKRDERRYAPRPVPDDVVERILDAGRLGVTDSGERGLCGRAVRSRDHQVEVVVRARLALDERVDAPAAVQAERDSGVGEPVERFDDVGGTHHRGRP